MAAMVGVLDGQVDSALQRVREEVARTRERRPDLWERFERREKGEGDA